MANEPTIHTVYKSLNKPLTIWGVDRRYFFFAVAMGGATFNMFSSFLGGILMFAALYVFARWATKHDAEILRIVLNSSRAKVLYDPGKLEYFRPRWIRHDQTQPHHS